jgi:hypothetical protein
MNNPFANFDLEESLSGLPGVLRQPMVLAVAASGLMHGLFFLALPVVTSSAESKKLPDRIVEMVQLTPEEQAKLPPSMTQVSMLPSMSGIQSPLNGLFSGVTPNSGIKITPPPVTNNPIDSWITKANQDAISYGSGSSSYGSLGAPIGGIYPLPRNNSSEDDAAKKAADQKQKQLDLEKAEADRKAKEEADKKAKEEAEKQTPTDPKTGLPIVAAGQTTTPPPPGTPASQGSAADLKNPTPAQIAQQQQLIAATTYDAKGTTADAQKARQDGANQAVLNQFAGLPKEQQESIAGAILFAPTIDTIAPLTPQLPSGTTLQFGDLARPAQVDVIVQAYVAEDGALLPYSMGEGQPLQPGLLVTTTSGFQYLDEQALAFIKEQLTKNPVKGKVQSIKYKVPFTVLPQQAQG